MTLRPLLGTALLLAAPALAQLPEAFYPQLSGSASVETRGFPAGSTADRVSASITLALEPQLDWSWSEGRRTFRWTPFLRLDPEDEERTHFDLRELYWQQVGTGWDLSVGLKKVFWGVAESQHLVDIINQTDLVEDIDAEEKLGQPMVQLGLHRPWGHLEVFLLPLFRERTFPQAAHRLSLGPIDPDRALYESKAGDGHFDLALRWSKVLGVLDLGIAGFRGTDRTPRFVPSPEGDGQILPFYRQIERLSLDLQATVGSWLFKLEALTESSREETASAAVGGFEFTLFNLAGSGLDLSFLSEAIWDERPTPFDEDLFAGVRLALNDVAGTTALLGAIMDAHGGGTFWNLEGRRRLGGRFLLSLDVRAFAGFRNPDLLHPIARDDYIRIELSRFF